MLLINKLLNFIVKYSIIFVILWAIIVLLLSALPLPKLNITPFWDRLSLDKLAHSLFYFILTFLLYLSFFSVKKPIFLKKYALYFSIIISIIYGGIIEILQAHIFINRFGDWIDFFANAIGCFLAIYLVKKVKFKSKI